MITWCRILTAECKKFKVKLHKPTNTTVFLEQVKILQTDRRKAEHVLLDEIENDIESKEKFITE